MVEIDLPLRGITCSGDEPEPVDVPHGEWMVASQECDLVAMSDTLEDPEVELRPVYRTEPPPDWGIRSARLLLSDEPSRYLIANSPRVHVAPLLLTTMLAKGAVRTDLDHDRRTAVKTWLGLRYDRPAVPDEFVDLAKRIAEEVARKPRRATGQKVRDVLMQFESGGETPRFSLFAVLEDDEDAELVREWLADIAQAVPTDMGLADELEVAPAARISLQLVETSYSADVTQLTWRGEEPEGAL